MTSPSTVCGDLRKWRCAQRASPPFADTQEVISWSVGSSTYSARGAPTTLIDEPDVRTPNFAPDGRRRPARTQVRTAIGRHLLARRCPPPGQSQRESSTFGGNYSLARRVPREHITSPVRLTMNCEDPGSHSGEPAITYNDEVTGSSPVTPTSQTSRSTRWVAAHTGPRGRFAVGLSSGSWGVPEHGVEAPDPLEACSWERLRVAAFEAGAAEVAVTGQMVEPGAVGAQRKPLTRVPGTADEVDQ
jgi:hypothetical protein